MKWWPPLRWTLPAVLGSIGIALVLLAFLDGVRHSEQLIEDEAAAQLAAFGTRLASRFEQLYAEADRESVRETVMRTMSEPHLTTLAIANSQGIVIESSDASLLGKPLEQFAPAWVTAMWRQVVASRVAEKCIDFGGTRLLALFPFSMPVQVGELRSTHEATIYLVSDLSEMKRLSRSRHAQRAWLMGAVVAVGLAIVWAYFHFAVTKRLDRLAAVMQRAGQDDLAADPSDIAHMGGDEVGRLGAGLAAMLTEMNQRRNQLAASEERYRSVVHAMSEGVFIFGADGTMLAANESGMRLFGFRDEHMMRQNVDDPQWQVTDESGRVLRPDEYPAMVALRTGEPQPNVVLGVRKSGGETRWITVNCEPVWLDGAHTARGAVATLTDITERRMVIAHSQRDREKLRAIVESAMDGVISTDGEGRITLFNHAAELMFGRPAAEMMGQPLDSLMPERFRQSHRGMLDTFAASGDSRRSMGGPGQFMGLRADGEEFPIEASISRVSVAGETVLTVILRDVSERQRIASQREHLESQLRQSQKLQSLGTLTGGIAHDFNNILTAITGNAKLAEEELDAEHMPRSHAARRSLQEIAKASLRATDLVRQVLTFGRRHEANRVPLDLAPVVADALKFLRATLPALINIRSVLPQGLPRVAADATQIHQVVANLGSNAAHAIGDRPGVIEVTLEAVEIDHDCARRSADLQEGLYVRLAFADSGKGIDPTIVDRIFEPFFTTKEVGRGTGLGLSVVHGIVKNHDGAIIVQSTPQVGTCFELYFPVTQRPIQTAEPVTTPLPSAPGEGRTVIYVDDEEALVFLMTRMLEKHGYRVLGFTRPGEALSTLAQRPQEIHALISDLSMPGMSGFDVVRRAQAVRSDLPLLLVSGFLRQQDLELAERLGVRRMLLKPDTVDALAASLHAAMSEG